MRPKYEFDGQSSNASQHDAVREQESSLAERSAVLDLELAPWLAMHADAESAVAQAERVVQLERTLPGLRSRATELNSKLDEARKRRVAAEQLAAEAASHVPEVRAARDRIVLLRAELPQREPLLAATDRELEELDDSNEAETVLERCEESNAITRRLRGLPQPEQQRETLASLRARSTRLEQARAQAVEQLAGLSEGFQQAERTVAMYGHLPDPDLQAQEARTLVAQEKQLRTSAASAVGELSNSEQELRELGDPLEQFRALHDGQEADEVLARAEDLSSLLEPIASQLALVRDEITAIRTALDDSLVRRCGRLRVLALSDGLPDDYHALTGLHEQVNATVRVAPDGETFAAVSVSELRDPAGNLILGGLRGTAAGKRIHVERIPDQP